MKRLLYIWAVFFITLIIANHFFGTETKEEVENKEPISIAFKDDSYMQDQEAIVTVSNNTDKILTIEDKCPSPALSIFKINKNGDREEVNPNLALDCSYAKATIIQPNSSENISLLRWKHSLFGETGTYQAKLELPKEVSEEVVMSETITITRKSTFRYFAEKIFYQPIYNAFIFFLKALPGKSLALSILIVTLIIRSILLIPNHKALKAQKEMQAIQPKLEEIKQKYKGQQEKIAQETMKIWKDHKVNPFGSCLPMLIQMPILLTMFYVIRAGLTPDNAYLLYNFMGEFNYEGINNYLLGFMDLTQVNLFIIPPIVGMLQFFQMKLFMPQKKQKKNENPNEMQMATSMMTYFMPLLIVVFSASMPAGVGFYWGLSTLFSIGQQTVINGKKKIGKELNKKGKEIIEQKEN